MKKETCFKRIFNNFKKVFIIFLISILIIINIFQVNYQINQNIINPYQNTPDLNRSEIHDPISIAGDIELDAFPDKTGNGTIIDPYVIKNLEINATGVFEAIEIQNTSKVVTIFNCTLTTSAIAPAGIFLNNVSYITIINNTINNNNDGIYINNSRNCTIIDNDILENISIIREFS
jgi:parallel beta-helix repeat protein